MLQDLAVSPFFDVSCKSKEAAAATRRPQATSLASRSKDMGCELQGVEMLREVASVDPHDYDQQQKDDAGGIRNVAAFVQELAERYIPQFQCTA